MATSRQIKFMRQMAKYHREERVKGREVRVTGGKSTVRTKLEYDVKNALRRQNRKYISDVTVYTSKSRLYKGTSTLHWMKFEDYDYDPNHRPEYGQELQRTQQVGWFSSKTGTFAGEENLKRALRSLDTAEGVVHSSEGSLLSMYDALPENSRWKAMVAETLIEWDWEDVFKELYPTKKGSPKLADTTGAEPEIATNYWFDAYELLSNVTEQYEQAQEFSNKMNEYKVKKKQ